MKKSVYSYMLLGFLAPSLLFTKPPYMYEIRCTCGILLDEVPTYEKLLDGQVSHGMCDGCYLFSCKLDGLKLNRTLLEKITQRRKRMERIIEERKRKKYIETLMEYSRMEEERKRCA